MLERYTPDPQDSAYGIICQPLNLKFKSMCYAIENGEKNRTILICDFPADRISFFPHTLTHLIHSSTTLSIFMDCNDIYTTSISFSRLFREYHCPVFGGVFWVPKTVDYDRNLYVSSILMNDYSCLIPHLGGKVDTSFS